MIPVFSNAVCCNAVKVSCIFTTFFSFARAFSRQGFNHTMSYSTALFFFFSHSDEVLTDRAKNQNAVGAGDLGISRPRCFRTQQLSSKYKILKANMMNISGESLSLIEDMVSKEFFFIFHGKQ